MKDSEETTVLVTAALIQRAEDGRFLLAQRPAGRPLAGRWEFPGGKVEPGEDPRAALARECREELAIGVHVGAIYETIFVPREHKPILLMFYVVTIVEGTPRPMEGNTLAWATPTEMAGYDILEPDLPLIQLLSRRPLPLEHADV